MNDIFWDLYWIDVLSGLFASLAMTSFACAVVGLLTALYAEVTVTKSPDTSAREDNVRAMRMVLRNVAIVAPVVFLLIAFVPDKKTMYMMLAVRTTDNVMQTDTGKKLMRALNDQLEEYIGKLEPAKK